MPGLHPSRSNFVRAILFFSLPALLAAGSTPANPRYAFQPLPERFDVGTITVTALAQDRTGLLWMGTQQGLLRYDGGRITKYGREDGLPTLFIDQLEVGTDGTVWVGTNDGIARYDHGKFVPVVIPVAGARFDAINQILAADGAGGIYVGTTAGLMHMDPQDPSKYRLWTRKDGLPADTIEAVFFAADNCLYFISGNRVGRLSGVDGKPEIRAPGIGTAATSRNIAVLVDRDHVIWVRTSDSVVRLDPSSSRFVRDDEGIPKANDFGIPVLDHSGRPMIPTVRGLFRRTAGGWEQIGERHGMQTNAVFAVTEDREGAIWIGYGGAGVARWPGSASWSGWTRQEGLPDNVVWCVMRDSRGRLWVGTDNGLAMWDPSSSRWRSWSEKDGLAGATVRQLASAPDGAVWTVSIPGGLSRIDADLRPVKVPALPGAGDAVGIALAGDGRIWAGNSRGLTILSMRNGRLVSESASVAPEASGTTSHPAFSPDGTLWTSGRKGISRFAGGKWSVYTTAQGLRANVVSTVLPVSADEVWFRYVEPLGLGHLKVGAGVEVRHVTSKEGMAGDSVFLLGADHTGRVWAGGSQGLSVIQPFGPVRQFDQADGLLWNDLSAGAFWADPDGSIYAGTSRGLARFNPNENDFKLPHTSVLITSAKLGGEERVEQREPSAPFSRRTFTAMFTELSLRDTEKTIYRYRLAGLESDYTETPLREARYVSIPSGSYRFEVSSKYPGGWSVPAVYSFSIDPAWWERWWARLAGLSVLALAIFGAIRLRTGALEADRKRLEAAVESGRAELAQANHELAEIALTDPLTKARNRRYFQLTIEVDVERCLRSYFDPNDGKDREDLVFFLVDIDYFKNVNDRFGHRAGDHVLTQIADRLSGVIRSSDTLVRWGGEEFLVVARGARRQEAGELARRILQAIGGEPFEADPFEGSEGGRLPCTCSVGWAAFPWKGAQPQSRSVTDLIQLVDRALYMAKHSGRNQAVGVAPADDPGFSSEEQAIMRQERVCVVRTAGPEVPFREALVTEEGIIPFKRV